jgi:hypothetical protein
MRNGPAMVSAGRFHLCVVRSDHRKCRASQKNVKTPIVRAGRVAHGVDNNCFSAAKSGKIHTPIAAQSKPQARRMMRGHTRTAPLHAMHNAQRPLRAATLVR